ncbi:MAG: hypothetical protein WC755_05325 [Candidatus Woesearchaeota archaeon]
MEGTVSTTLLSPETIQKNIVLVPSSIDDYVRKYCEKQIEIKYDGAKLSYPESFLREIAELNEISSKSNIRYIFEKSKIFFETLKNEDISDEELIERMSKMVKLSKIFEYIHTMNVKEGTDRYLKRISDSNPTIFGVDDYYKKFREEDGNNLQLHKFSSVLADAIMQYRDDTIATLQKRDGLSYPASYEIFARKYAIPFYKNRIKEHLAEYLFRKSNYAYSMLNGGPLEFVSEKRKLLDEHILENLETFDNKSQHTG